jgi:peptidoglycan/LPS O-acetylase OafA/YrhL
MSDSRSGYIATLDGWRAIAVLLVIAAHASRLMRETHTSIGAHLASFFEHGGFGVDIFFALSGYLICTLLLREQDRNSIDLWGFYRRRFFRIVPPMAAYLAAVIALGLLGLVKVSQPEIAAVLLFCRNYVGGAWYTGHFWSLGVEEHFYIVVPLILAFCSLRNALKIAFATALGCAVIRFIEWKYSTGMEVEFRTEARFDTLMYGAIVAIALHTPAWRDWIGRRLTLPVAAALLAVALILLVSVPAMPARRTVVALTLPILVAYTVLSPRSIVGRLLETGWLRYIGRLSYSLYLWQMLFFVPRNELGWIQSFPGALLATAVCAIGSYYLVEQPAIAFGRRLIASKRVAFAKIA